MSRILVTGAAGFVGSHLCDRLLAQGHHVAGIDDMSVSMGKSKPRDCEDFHRGAVSEWLPHAPDYAPNIDPCDTIYHLAGRVGVGQILTDPWRMLQEHVEDGLAVIAAAERWNATLVIASSSEVYGSTPDVCRETDTLHIGSSDQARSGYAASKLWLECAALAAYRQRGVKAVVTRLFNVAGPRQRAEGGCVLPKWAKAALSGEAIPLYRSGAQVRCFTHVVDTVDALIALDANPEAAGQVVNVGQPRSITMFEAAEDLAAYCRVHYGVRAPIDFVGDDDLPRDGGWQLMQQRVPDVTKLHALTGLTLPDRWRVIVAQTCDDWAARLGVTRKEKAA